jgi:hypothetical protein
MATRSNRNHPTPHPRTITIRTYSYDTPQERNNISPSYTCASPSPASFPTLALQRSPRGPILRANPFPEVTDLFCRLPLPTLFYWPEAFHLGDLLRIWVRLCTKLTHLSPRFSRANVSASDGTRSVPLLVVAIPISGQTNSRVHVNNESPLNKKRQLSPKLTSTSLSLFVLPHAMARFDTPHFSP